MSAVLYWLGGILLGLLITMVGIVGMVWFREPSNPGARRDRLDRKAEVERRARSRR